MLLGSLGLVITISKGDQMEGGEGDRNRFVRCIN